MAVRVGILGLGLMGKVHFGAYSNIRGAKVTALCDTAPARRKGAWRSVVGNIAGRSSSRDGRGIRTYGDAEELFVDPNVDAVDVTLPTDLHAEMSIRALRSGKHVICEKPMALNSRPAT